MDAFRDGDAERAAALGRAWANFDTQLTHHHKGEHEVAWPHLERAGITRELLDQMDAEHEVMAAALAGARTAMADLEREPTRERADTALAAMEDLRTATVTHLDHEERELEAFYVENAEHPEVRAMEGEFRKQSPAVGGRFFAWIADGITPEARAAIPFRGWCSRSSPVSSAAATARDRPGLEVSGSSPADPTTRRRRCGHPPR